MMTWIKIIFITPVAVFLFIFLVLVRNTLVRSYVPPYSEMGSPKEYGMNFQEVDFLSSDKVRLNGWLIARDKARPVIILCHGLGTNKSDCLEVARTLYLANYNLFMFDFRAHGRSKGLITSFGYREQRDLQGAIEYLKVIGFKRLGVFGISMGGSVAIMVAARNTALQATVVDSPYVDLDESIVTHTKLVLGLPFNFLGRLAVFAYRLRFFVDSSKVSPLKVISRISPRPILIINGASDDRMSLKDAQRLFLAAAEPRDLWLVPGAQHLESFWKAPQDYKKRLVDFFNRVFFKDDKQKKIN